jgi:predicted house-cleaning NTP pyrophosphatase (Maf/HAM1 superfamily)
MTDLKKAAQQALEALEKTHTQPGCEQWQAERKASVALRAALEQPEQAEPVVMSESTALRLADELEAWTLGKPTHHREAAAELRRLHALNGELLEALTVLCESHKRFSGGVWDSARAAIARAEGKV